MRLSGPSAAPDTAAPKRGKAGEAASRAAIQSALVYEFRDPVQLQHALTHDSAIKDVKKRLAGGYQRLEFLGDRVLGLVIADMLYRAYPDLDEGALARRFTQLVRGESCARVAQDWGLAEHVRFGEKERVTSAGITPAVLSDVCESVIGAVFVDGGYAPARRVIESAWRPLLAELGERTSDPKSSLQEWAQARALPTPDYKVLERSGPDHAPKFKVEVSVQGLANETGEGATKRDAQQAAAQKLLQRETIWSVP